ncbi:MAG: dephospho-CoA kinase, partial [Acutalibacteraceae bacterium]
MKEIYVVGLTGPTGAGKTTVADIFRKKGINVIDADKVANDVTDHSSKGLAELVVAFGNEILNQDGTLNRSKLAAIAFSSPELTRRLNDTIHPIIIMEIRKRIRDLARSGAKICILDAALLFESSCHVLCNDAVSVIADDDVRLKRIISRDSISEEAARRRMSAQHDNSFYINHSNHIITNNGDFFALEQQVN